MLGPRRSHTGMPARAATVAWPRFLCIRSVFRLCPISTSTSSGVNEHCAMFVGFICEPGRGLRTTVVSIYLKRPFSGSVSRWSPARSSVRLIPVTGQTLRPRGSQQQCRRGACQSLCCIRIYAKTEKSSDAHPRIRRRVWPRRRFPLVSTRADETPTQSRRLPPVDSIQLSR